MASTAPASEGHPGRIHMTSSLAEQLRSQLAEKDAELKAVREELRKTAMHISASSAIAGEADGVVSRTDDKESLRKQLNEATARWRWEERRAKAREEELEQTAQTERARVDAIAKDLELLRTELSQTKDKVREATRKRAQIQAEQTAMKAEFETLKAKAAESEIALSYSEERVKDTTRAFHDARHQIDTLQMALNELKVEKDHIEQERNDLKEAAEERDIALEKVVKMEAQLAASEERASALKQTMRHNAQLVKDLKAELSKSMPHPATPVPPLSPPANDLQKSSSSPSKEENDGLLKDLASRLESLLKENGGLHERIKFLEDIVQGLTADLNRATGKVPPTAPSPNSNGTRPPSLRLRQKQ